MKFESIDRRKLDARSPPKASRSLLPSIWCIMMRGSFMSVHDLLSELAPCKPSGRTTSAMCGNLVFQRPSRRTPQYAMQEVLSGPERGGRRWVRLVSCATPTQPEQT